MEDITVSVEEMINFIFKKCGESVDKDTIATWYTRRIFSILWSYWYRWRWYLLKNSLRSCLQRYNILYLNKFSYLSFLIRKK